MGGEEFSILFPGKSVKAVLPHLESLRSTIETSRFQLRREQERREQERRRQESQTDPSRELRVNGAVSVQANALVNALMNGEARTARRGATDFDVREKSLALLVRVRHHSRTTSSR